MTLPRLSQRLECMLFRRKLELEIEEIRPELNITRNASQELRASLRFKAVLQVIQAPTPICLIVYLNFYRLSLQLVTPSMGRLSGVAREASSWMLFSRYTWRGLE